MIDKHTSKAHTLFVRFILSLLVVSMTGCASFKIVHIPIPIPTFGIGKGKSQDQKPVISKEASDREVVATGEATGKASWYGRKFHGRKTANGERYNMYAMTAAHRTLDFDTKVRVTNLENNNQVVVRINDRGPFIKGRIIDLSRGAARRLDFINEGIIPVKIEVLN